MSFKIVDRTGFEIKLDNGWTVAARFGPTAYCGNNTSLNGRKEQLEVNLRGESWEGANVEVRAFTNNKEYIFQQTGKPYKGWVGVEEFISFVTMVSHWPDSKHNWPSSSAPCS